jgi:hypothetical protein
MVSLPIGLAGQAGLGRGHDPAHVAGADGLA